ncbi:PREDICTED: WASH complex subunit CCDC53 homolog [Bactrocera latifrons]|uniref:WASH complex subunit CCDC53 n=1 Tax=Bactrocera latifrons TaxID=174628 RepID=A0A0K8TW31_BACLA|nr:PREDICTED: WASH complex subunit CCDC53 homolog [Bactrocera latifrons]
MDTEILSQAVDKSQMPPLHQKRVLAFINHFIINSCNFLNDFALKCESKFVDLERKMQKVEAALTIIEAKLASVPDVTDPTSTPTASNTATEKVTIDAAEKTETKPSGGETTTTDNASDVPESTEDATPEPAGVRAYEDVRFKKFFKMVQFGVPAGAVKIKMQAEGVEPSILDNPNLLLTDGVTE